MKNNKTKDIKGSFKVILRILKDTRPIAPMLLFAVAVTLLGVFASMAAPDVLANITDSIYGKLTHGEPIARDTFLAQILTLTVLYLLTMLFGSLRTLIMNYSVSRHFTCRLRIRMSEKIAKIPVKTVDTTPNGEIISRMTNDVSIMGGTVHDIFGVLINGIIHLSVIIVVIFIANPIMASAIVFFVPLSIILSLILASRSEKHFNESRASAGKLYALCEEDLTGFDTVKAFSLEPRQKERYSELITDYSEKARRGFLVSGTVQPIVSFINSIAYIAISLIGGMLAISGEITAGDLVAFIMYTRLFASPLESIAGGMSMMQSAIASARRVYDYLDGTEMSSGEPDSKHNDVRGEVVFDGVYFSYTEDKPLIENLNLTVSPGQKVAIVGPTGSGKTTVVNLLMRFYDPDKGRILIDGEDTVTISRESVRDKMGMVLQDTKLFTGTVTENIAYGNPDATREDIMAAARHAHIDSFIDALPSGYDTVINEDSTNISGGQKQLLTIARAYLANRPILILDEATSNVDTRTELLIQQTMDELMAGRTAFVIAHRLSTVENADLILVVDSGKIVEQGCHQELIKAGGLYAKMHKSQYS